MEAFLGTENILNLITLTGLEIVLGIDNVIFIALLVEPLPPQLRQKIRIMGLTLALVLRVLLLLTASWIMGLTEPLFTLFNFDYSGRSLLLIFGGLFLIIKPMIEFVEMFKAEHHSEAAPREPKALWKVVTQIIFIDLVLSFDSIITAVGMSNNIPVIITAIVISMIIMILCSKPVGEFIYTYPSVKVIGLTFIILVGVLLVAAGFNIDIDKAYLYSAMFFSSGVETINILLSKKNNKSR